MDSHNTEKTRRRYDRIAPMYHLMEGTGKNIRFYPPGSEGVALDFSPAMLTRAVSSVQSLIRSRDSWRSAAFSDLNPVVVRMMGANIDRDTRQNLERADLSVESEADLWIGIVKLFVARPR